MYWLSALLCNKRNYRIPIIKGKCKTWPVFELATPLMWNVNFAARPSTGVTTRRVRGLKSFYHRVHDQTVEHAVNECTVWLVRRDLTGLHGVSEAGTKRLRESNYAL